MERDSIELPIEFLELICFSRVRHYDVPDRPIRPAGRLLDAAQTCGAGLLVMGGYGRKPRRRDPGGAERDDDAAAPDALNGVGTLKAWMGATHFLTRTLDKVRTEMSLHVLAYNLKRMI